MLNENSRCFFQLLVVIAIIAILAGILMPALSQARERGKTNVCLNNLKQCGLAIFQYIDDHKSMIIHSPVAGNSNIIWSMLINKEVKSCIPGVIPAEGRSKIRADFI